MPVGLRVFALSYRPSSCLLFSLLPLGAVVPLEASFRASLPLPLAPVGSAVIRRSGLSCSRTTNKQRIAKNFGG